MTNEEALNTAYRLVELLHRYPARPMALRWYDGHAHRIPAEQLMPEDFRGYRLIGVYTKDASVEQIMEDILWHKSQIPSNDPATTACPTPG
jgi:hypothetical protein